MQSSSGLSKHVFEAKTTDSRWKQFPPYNAVQFKSVWVVGYEKFA